MNRKALWFCLGTAGELIKLYPLMEFAQRRGIPWYVLATGQSGINFWKQWDDFGLDRSRVAVLVTTQEDLKTSSMALKWFKSAVLSPKSRLKSTLEKTFGRSPAPGEPWLVHGDTLSTLVGAWIGKRLKATVCHVEAGLRSTSLFEPFPEEIDRRLVSRISRIHFPQDDLAHQNLRRAKVKGEIVPTHGNTLIDALSLVLESKSSGSNSTQKYVVANLHRFENLKNASRWKQMVEILIDSAKRTGPVHFVLHPPTQAKLEQDEASRKALEAAGVKLIPRMRFKEFVRLLDGADYVISDGGSNQEECSYLGKPCLLLRDATERQEGLDHCCVLSRFDPVLIQKFLNRPDDYRSAPLEGLKSPSNLIVDHLQARGLV